MEELARERQRSDELKQKLAAAEKELKSSAVMNLELEDYQRSMKSLEEQLTTRSSELERVRKDGQLQHDAMMQLKKELGSACIACFLYDSYYTKPRTCMYMYMHVHVHVNILIRFTKSTGNHLRDKPTQSCVDVRVLSFSAWI
jgi:hypothetical protein